MKKLRSSTDAASKGEFAMCVESCSRDICGRTYSLDKEVTFLIFFCFLKGQAKNGGANAVRTFAAPEDTLEESLLASGINTEGYTITNKLSELARQRSRHVANSKFYVRGTIYVDNAGDNSTILEKTCS